MAETEVIYGQVVAKANNYQAVPDGQGGRRIIKNDEVRRYEKNFLNQCKVYRNRLIARPFRLVVKVFESSSRYDLDNSLKTILDCLQYAKAIKDDNLCMSIQAEKRVDVYRPRIEYSIIEYEPTLFT